MNMTKILEDFEDLNEPPCMDKVLMCIEEIQAEDEMFMELLVNKLANQDISWEQPWYQETNSVTRPLNVSQENYKEKFKTDTICQAESNLILKNWHEFVEEFEVPDRIICIARWKNKGKCRLPKTPEECARRFVLSYLARGLERTIFQVFRHIQTHFGGPVKGPYSPVEENIMEICFIKHPNNCVPLLSMVLGREPRGIYKRLQQKYKGKPVKKRIKWTLPLATKLLRLLMEYTGLPLEELKHRKFDKEVWLKISEQFDHHYIYLQEFWYSSLHVQIFVRSTVKLNKLRRKILKCLKLSPYQIWSDIRWKEVLRLFPEGYTHNFLYKLCYRLICKEPKYNKEPLHNLIDKGLNNINKRRKRRLRSLQLNESGELEVLYKQ